MKRRTAWFENFIQYVGCNLTKVLIFAVILSTGLMMNLVTKTKYISYVNGYSHAVAGNFHFTSNYLKDESEQRTYIINDWEQDSFKVDLRIQNFDNSLLYNDEKTGCYYCVDAVMYKDAAYTVPDMADAGQFKATITYPADAETITYKGKTYVYLPGQVPTEDKPFDKAKGTHMVNVAMNAETEVAEKRYLKITARTMTVSEMKDAGLPIPEGAIFDTRLAANFELRINNGAVIVPGLTYDKSNNSTELIYSLTCTSTEGGASSKVRVYFDSAKVKFEDVLRYPVTKRNLDKADDTYRYIQLDVYSTSITNLVFFKRKMSDEVGVDITQGAAATDTIYYELVTYTQN